MPSNDENRIEALFIEIDADSKDAASGLQKLTAAVERLDKAVHKGGLDQLYEKLHKIAGVSLGKTAKDISALADSTAKLGTSNANANARELANRMKEAGDFAQRFANGIWQAGTKAASMNQKAEALKNTMSQATEAAKKFDASYSNLLNEAPNANFHSAHTIGDGDKKMDLPFNTPDEDYFADLFKYTDKYEATRKAQQAKFEAMQKKPKEKLRELKTKLSGGIKNIPQGIGNLGKSAFQSIGNFGTFLSDKWKNTKVYDHMFSSRIKRNLFSDTVGKTKSFDYMAKEAFKNFPKNLGNGIEKIEQRMENIGTNVGKWYQGMKKVEDPTKRVHSSMSAIKTILLYSGLFTLLSTITKGITTGMQNVAQASDYANDVLSRYATTNYQLQNSIGSALIPVLDLLYPIVNWLANGLINVSNAINMLGAAVTGETSFDKANRVAQDYAKTLNTVKAALAGFDEINVLTPINTETYTKTEFSGLDVAGSALEIVGLVTGFIGLRMILKGLDFSKIVTWLGDKLPEAAGKVTKLNIGGFFIELAGSVWFAYEAIDAFENGLDAGNTAQMLMALGVAAGGATLAFGKLGGKITLIAGGAILAIAGVCDSWNNGINWLNSLLTVGGATLTGAIIGSFFGPVGTGAGALIGFLVGGFANVVVVVKENWASFANWWITLWENICNTVIRVGNKIAEVMAKVGVGDGVWKEEITLARVENVSAAAGAVSGAVIPAASGAISGAIKLPAYATGGFPEDGLFMANHNEIIGTFAGRAAVANNFMIVEGIADGVKEAQSDQNELIREQNELLRQLLKKSGGSVSVSAITKALDRQNRRAGRVVVPVGT
ncbi:MAG: hypothetical protein IJW55_07640 [Clostridia bacterium]|nr:hypothetical protein [Clostridia bacterium]